MPLTWSCKKVEGYQALHEDDMEQSKTTYLCFELMRVGVSTVTSANVAEVWNRIRVAQKLWGATVTFDGKDAPYTREDIYRRIGYSTNVSNFTRKQFTDRLLTE
jgi:hypothetical protein